MSLYQIIETEAALQEILPIIWQETEIGIDTEFDNNRLRYGMNLCVIQIATSRICYIIDPLRLCLTADKKLDFNKLQPIWDIIASDKILKVVFSCLEDLQLFARHCRPAHFYDLSVAVRLLALPYPSFAAITQHLLQHEIDKGTQCADWYIRPFTSDMVDYLVKDVLYLCELRALLDAQLQAAGRRSWFDEEMESILENAAPPDRQAALERSAEAKFKTHLQADYYRFVIKELIALRDSIAQRNNVPDYFVFNNEKLTNIAHALDAMFDGQEKPDFSVLDGGIHSSLKSDKQAFIAQLRAIYLNAHAQGLSRSKNSAAPPRSDFNRKDLDRFLERFEPIRTRLIEKFGEPIQQLLMSNNQLKKAFLAKSLDVLRRYAVHEITLAGEEVQQPIEKVFK